VDSLLQRLSEESSSPLEGAKTSSTAPKEYENSSNGSVPITPATDTFSDTVVVIDAGELQRLKSELAESKNVVARMNHELQSTHQIKSTFDQAIGQSSDTDYYFKGDVSEQTISQLQNKFNASTRLPAVTRQESWPSQEDHQSEKGDVKPFGQAIWNNGARQSQYGNGWGMNMSTQDFGPVQPRPGTGHSAYRRNNGYNEPTHFPLDQSFRTGLASNPPSRPGSAFDGPRYNQFNGYANAVIPGGAMSPPPMSMPAPIGINGMYSQSNALTPYSRMNGAMTRLSPEAAEFNVDPMAPTPWNSQVATMTAIFAAKANLTGQPPSESGHYINPGEPMNYRRLLDRNMNCNWKYIVDKIICNNDQQASIFLQQVRRNLNTLHMSMVKLTSDRN
jgi:hypothetical protein